MIRGLIFDFDGLILETEGPVYQSWVELYQEYGQELPFEVWATIIGTASQEHFNPFEMLEEKIGKKLDRENLSARRVARELELIHAQTVLPGVEEKITSAKALGLKLGIASSSDREWVVGHLTRLRLAHHFDAIHTADDVEHTKPDPELYRLALRSLGLRPQEAIVFEDSPNGVKAARSAGIFTIAVPNPLTRQLSLDHADLILDSLVDLPLDQLLARAKAAHQR